MVALLVMRWLLSIRRVGLIIALIVALIVVLLRRRGTMTLPLGWIWAVRLLAAVLIPRAWCLTVLLGRRGLAVASTTTSLVVVLVLLAVVVVASHVCWSKGRRHLFWRQGESDSRERKGEICTDTASEGNSLYVKDELYKERC